MTPQTIRIPVKSFIENKSDLVEHLEGEGIECQHIRDFSMPAYMAAFEQFVVFPLECDDDQAVFIKLRWCDL